ncbi:MAG: peptide-methionine (S)-S-oxide reductase MsrA [Actinomycetales bacterium]|nr:peptide-methionine (S)-S-oxide reductase MsrA [Actinomycetales bacterium]
MAGVTTMVTRETALPGRTALAFPIPDRHAVSGTALWEPYPTGLAVTYLALGCFWGAERLMWTIPGVWSTAVGYMGGFTPFPTYEEVCTGRTGHTETVQVVYDPALVAYATLLTAFWQEHDPTQGARQGNDVGTQYRSALFPTSGSELATAEQSRVQYQAALHAAGRGAITTEIIPAAAAGPCYPAEAYHQQYLHKVPGGYCGLAGTGVACPGLSVQAR